jgi:hypothetical protein
MDENSLNFNITLGNNIGRRIHGFILETPNLEIKVIGELELKIYGRYIVEELRSLGIRYNFKIQTRNILSIR